MNYMELPSKLQRLENHLKYTPSNRKTEFVKKKGEKKKDCRGHTDLNHGPIDLQSIALPLSYTPALVEKCSQCCS